MGAKNDPYSRIKHRPSSEDDDADISAKVGDRVSNINLQAVGSVNAA